MNTSNVKTDKKSTIVGVILMLLGFALLFIKTNYNIPQIVLWLLIIAGFLCLFVKDRLIDFLFETLRSFRAKHLKK